MEPPVVPFRRTRLVRDYIAEEDLAILQSYMRPQRYLDDFPSPPPTDSADSRPDDGRTTSFRVRSPEIREDKRDTLDQSSIAQSQDATSEPAVRALQDDLRKLDFNLQPIDENLHEKSSYAPSVSSFAPSQHTGISNSSTNKMPDFFSNEIFQIVLKNPTTSHQLLKFSQSRLCGENLEFLEKVDRYQTLLNDVAKIMFEIHKGFIAQNSQSQINIPGSMLLKLNRDLKTSLTSTLPKLESVFVDSQSGIESLVAADIYPRFVRHQMTMSAAKALAENRHKYAGLGDCFVLTDPSKADNPIVHASDGFVKVTGYPRNEIIPRNCRFLQCRYTDRAAVKRLREAINKREESVELLLNQKKNGEPFWNLLYTCPLFDDRGNVVFFLGGQINCSTTIHNASDIIRILSLSNDIDEERAPETLSAGPLRPSRSSRLLSVLRSGSKSAAPARAPGMENNLLERIEKMNLKKQMDVFHTAYSKYLVVNYSTFLISFHSAGIVDLLYPANPIRSDPTLHLGLAVGADVFKFLTMHSSASGLGREFKARVKYALKLGQPLSLDITLCTRRYMGFEKFVAHWTPLKGEAGEVSFVVLTLGGQGD